MLNEWCCAVCFEGVTTNSRGAFYGWCDCCRRRVCGPAGSCYYMVYAKRTPDKKKTVYRLCLDCLDLG